MKINKNTSVATLNCPSCFSNMEVTTEDVFVKLSVCKNCYSGVNIGLYTNLFSIGREQYGFGNDNGKEGRI